MFEILGIAFGGISRLVQHGMEMKEKRDEMSHEAVMFDKQVLLQQSQAAAEKDLRKMDVESTHDSKELDALTAAINSQATEAAAAGGWAATLSATVRPFISFWLFAIYSASKAATIYLALKSGLGVADAMKACYTEFDAALLGSVVSFWFADRSLRKAGK